MFFSFSSFFRLLNLFLCSLSILACSAIKVNKSPGLSGIRGQGGLLNTSGVAPSSSQEQLEEILGKKLLVKDFDIPVVKNSKVEFWVKYFSGKGRKSFERYMRGLAEFSLFLHPILEQYEIPKDLVYLAMIESGFSTRARSFAGAVGVWQFIRSTGRLYGLRQDWWVDERKDPLKSSHAAAKYLKKLYKKFGTWELAAAAYNGGEGRVQRGIDRHKTKNYWLLSRRRALRRETIHYVPKMMAAAIIAKNPSVFGFEAARPGSYWLHTSKVLVKKPTGLRVLAKSAGITVSELRKLNPELRRWSTPPRSYYLRVPSLEAVGGVKQFLARSSSNKYNNFLRYRVREGDTLSFIANKYAVPVGLIVSLNNIRRSHFIRAGTVLTVPVDSSRKLAMQQKRKKKAIASSDKPHLLHMVKKDDTLYDISRRYNTTVRKLKRWNLIVYHRKIQPGQILRIYLR